MKKIVLLTGFCFLYLFSAVAQNQKNYTNAEEERKDLFFGVGIKGNIYVNRNGVHDVDIWKKPSLGGQVFVGKWFNPYLGSRIVLEAGRLNPYFNSMKHKTEESYFLGRIDLLLELTNCFRSYRPDSFYNLMPYIGIGGAHAFNAKKRPDNRDSFSSPLFGGGLYNTFRLSDKLTAFLDIGMDIVDVLFDGSKGGDKRFNGITAGAIGITVKF